MSIYFTDLDIVHLFQSMLFYLSVIVYEGTFIALCLIISWTCSLTSYSPVYHLLSGTLYVGVSNCFMSAYFTDLLFVYLIFTVYHFTF